MAHIKPLSLAGFLSLPPLFPNDDPLFKHRNGNFQFSSQCCHGHSPRVAVYARALPLRVDAPGAARLLDAKKKQKTGGVLGELVHLDQKRYEELPGVPDRTNMTKKDLTWAMDWKLCDPLTKFSPCPRASKIVKLLTENIISMHGTNRPSLPGLIAQNSEEFVESTTKSAFALYKSDSANHTAPLKKLEELKGVGPATASLLLSILDGDNAPFFSDELFRWVCWDEALGGWKRKIKYDKKEYGMLWEGVKALRERLGEGVSAVDLEKCAYVCGKLAIDKKLEAEVRKDAEKRQNEAAETKLEAGASSSKQTKDEVDEISKSPPIPTVANTEQAKKLESKPAKKKSAKRSSPEPETEGPAPDAQASTPSISSPPNQPTAKTEQAKKPEPKPTKKSVKRSSPEPETDDPLSDVQASSTSSSPPKKPKTEHKKKTEEDATAEQSKPSAKPTKPHPPPASAPKVKSGPNPAAAASAAGTAGAAKPKTTAKASSAPKAKKPAKVRSGGENSRVLRPRKEMSYET